MELEGAVRPPEIDRGVFEFLRNVLRDITACQGTGMWFDFRPKINGKSYYMVLLSNKKYSVKLICREEDEKRLFDFAFKIIEKDLWDFNFGVSDLLRVADVIKIEGKRDWGEFTFVLSKTIPIENIKEV